MKATRLVEPPPTPPIVVRLELTEREAILLYKLSWYDMSIPTDLGPLAKEPKETLKKFLCDLGAVLSDIIIELERMPGGVPIC